MTTYTYIYFSLSLLLKERKNFWVYVFFGYLQTHNRTFYFDGFEKKYKENSLSESTDDNESVSVFSTNSNHKRIRFKIAA